MRRFAIKNIKGIKVSRRGLASLPYVFFVHELHEFEELKGKERIVRFAIIRIGVAGCRWLEHGGKEGTKARCRMNFEPRIFTDTAAGAWLRCAGERQRAPSASVCGSFIMASHPFASSPQKASASKSSPPRTQDYGAERAR